MKKKVKSYIKLQVLSGMANPSPPVGPALGQKGVNIMSFCKSFNEKTKDMEKGVPIPVLITVYYDRSFSFIIKTPPVSVLLKKFISIKKGSIKPKHEIVGYVKKSEIMDIAKIKEPDMTGSDIISISKCIIGTALSMGLKIKD